MRKPMSSSGEILILHDIDSMEGNNAGNPMLQQGAESEVYESRA